MHPATRINTIRTIPFFLGLLPLFLLSSVSLHGQAASPDPQRQSLGSLHTTGDVFVNEAKVPSETTIFPGDAVRTGDNGTAILTTTGSNSFEIARGSEVAFTGETRYFAELKMGTISVKSMGGGSGAALRAANFVVVPTNRDVRTVVTITRMADGSYLLTCTEGNAGVVPMQQAQGLFLEAGQSARISPQGELAAIETPPSGTAHAGTRRNYWLVIGLAGAGVAGGVAAAVVLSNHQPVSPAAP